MDGLAEDEQKPILALIGHIAEYGPLANPKKFKQLHGEGRGLVQLRSYQHRILGFYGRDESDGKPTIILTNAFAKKGRRTPATEIERALEAKARYEEGGLENEERDA